MFASLFIEVLNGHFMKMFVVCIKPFSRFPMFVLFDSFDHSPVEVIQQMGKKLKKNSRQAWKKSEVAKEYEDKMKEIREEERIQNTADSALFFEDKTGIM